MLNLPQIQMNKVEILNKNSILDGLDKIKGYIDEVVDKSVFTAEDLSIARENFKIAESLEEALKQAETKIIDDSGDLNEVLNHLKSVKNQVRDLRLSLKKSIDGWKEAKINEAKEELSNVIKDGLKHLITILPYEYIDKLNDFKILLNNSVLDVFKGAKEKDIEDITKKYIKHLENDLKLKEYILKDIAKSELVNNVYNFKIDILNQKLLMNNKEYDLSNIKEATEEALFIANELAKSQELAKQEALKRQEDLKQQEALKQEQIVEVKPIEVKPQVEDKEVKFNRFKDILRNRINSLQPQDVKTIDGYLIVEFKVNKGEI